MKLKEKISLEEVCGQTFKIRVVEASEYGKAALTHYLHNHNNGVSQFYKKEAIHHIKRELEYKFPNEDITSKVAEDALQYMLFDVAEIIKKKKPKAIFLENVKGLVNHDKGKTLTTILNVLRNDLGYYVPEPQIMNAKDFGVPQNRERIYIVGFRNDLGIESFEYPKPLNKSVSFEDIKEEKTVSVKYYHSETYLNTLINHKKRHESKGNGFGYEIIPDSGTANAVVCGGMGRERNLVYDHRLEDFNLGVTLSGRAFRFNLFVRSSQKGFSLQSLTQNAA